MPLVVRPSPNDRFVKCLINILKKDVVLVGVRLIIISAAHVNENFLNFFHFLRHYPFRKFLARCPSFGEPNELMIIVAYWGS